MQKINMLVIGFLLDLLTPTVMTAMVDTIDYRETTIENMFPNTPYVNFEAPYVDLAQVYGQSSDKGEEKFIN